MDSLLRQRTPRSLIGLGLSLGLAACGGTPDGQPGGGASPETTDFPDQPTSTPAAAPAAPTGDAATPAPASPTGPSEPGPAGELPMGRLVFDSTRGESQDIWVLEAGLDEPRQLTTDEATDRLPALSPDGSSVVFSSDRVGGPDSPSGLRTYGLYVVDVDGSEPEHLLGERTFNSGARYSPDGSQIGFGSDASGTTQVYVMNADGSGSPEALTDDPVQAGMGDWSPDGQQIVFTSLRDSEGTDYNREIYVMNADGSDQGRLTDDPANDSSPDWSPDGEWIVFSSDRSGNHEIYVMRPDGTELTQLTNDPEDDRFPTWSPDGSMVAWDTVRDGNAEIYVMNADGSGQINVTNNPAEDQFPDWGPA